MSNDINVGAISEALNNKLDLDLNNLSQVLSLVENGGGTR